MYQDLLLSAKVLPCQNRLQQRRQSTLRLPINLGLRLQTTLQKESLALQSTMQKQNIGRDYVQMAVSILKDPSLGQDPRIRVWATNVLKDNSPTPLPIEVTDDLKSGKTRFPSTNSAYTASPVVDSAFKLAADIHAFVSQAALKTPKYGTRPKRTPVVGNPPPDFVYKQMTLREYDQDVAADFHKRFDKRIETILAALPGAIYMLSTTNTIEVCHGVSGIHSATVCANQIFNDASMRSPD
jgi:hypothetical protein